MEKGFTIIEIIIAIFILSVAVIGVYSAFLAVSILASDSKDRLTAAYLSQEGVEIIRSIRDTNWLNYQPWDQYVDNCASGCQISYKDIYEESGGHILSVWSGSGTYLKIDSDGFYSYPAQGAYSVTTKFKRKVTVTPLNDYVLKVTSEVWWDLKATILSASSNAGEQECPPANCIKTEETLYDWL